MIYYEQEPECVAISDYVKCFWMSDSQDSEGISTVLPDGYFDLIFRFQDAQLASVFLTGTWTIPVDVPYAKHTRYFGVRFKLLASEYIFNESIERIIDTSTVLPSNFWDVELSVFRSFEIFVQAFSCKIECRVPAISEVDARKLRLVQILYDEKGSITVAELANRVGWSARQINRWFNNQFGLSLKKFSGILKCHATYGEIANGKLHPVSGYYDQAHLIKEIKRYTGATPKILHENKNVRFLQLSTQVKP